MRLLPAAAVIASLATAFVAVPASSALAAPPTPPDGPTSRSHLSAIRTAAEGSSTGYSRDKFPHWITISGTCNTRETVLKRDGTSVVTGSDCYPTSGRWYSPYDGATWTVASDIDIDHMVPLAEAWRSGASSWTTSRRQQFANDLSIAQLWAVTDNVNQSKGDQDPAEWKPSRTTFHCMYARSWVHVKYTYGLSADSAEKSALSSMLSGC
ncbi:HNH endonuclease family protein [Spirillospora sp. CA-294931]|uniref:HNH endonuclease family protein n=1 Tax=Spirillospora sp. CA-294931 TaxID=3240042 RepID=UPI003D8A6495